MWTRYQVQWNFFDRLCGGTPGNPELVKKWLDARKPRGRPAETRDLSEIASEVAETLLMPEQEMESPINVFQRDDGRYGLNGLVMRMGNVRAHIKDCARVLSSMTGKIEGQKSFSVRCINSIYYPPSVYWLPILDEEGDQFREADGIVEQPVHFMTPMGERSAIKVFEFVEQPTLKFELWILQTLKGKDAISRADLETIFLYGGVKGFGAERSRGEGKYSFEVGELEAFDHEGLVQALKRNTVRPDEVEV